MDKVYRIDLPLPQPVMQALEQLASQSGRSPERLAVEVLEDFVGWRSAQLQDLQEAIAAADRGEFATEDEVQQLFQRHGA